MCLPILAVCQFANVARVDDIDATLFAYYGKRMLAGQRLYVDLWDNKPPGIFWIDAISLFISGGKFWGIALVTTSAVAGTVVLFFLTARRLFGLPTAAIGTVMASLYVNFYHYHVGANRPSTFYVFCEIAVLYCYCRAFDGWNSSHRADGVQPLFGERYSARASWLFAAGVMAACAIGFRQTSISVAAAIVVHQAYLVATRVQRPAAMLRVAGLCTAGGVATALVVVVVLAATSDLKLAWHGAVASNLGYVTHSKQSNLFPREIFQLRDHVRWLGLPVILAVASVIYRIGWRVYMGKSDAVNRRLGGPPNVFALLVAWFPIAFYLALIGPHRAHHYYGIALAPLVMLATHGVWLLMRKDERVRVPRYSVVLAVLWFVYMAVPAGSEQFRNAMRAKFERFDDRSVDRWADTTAAILEHTSPTDQVHAMRYLPAVFWRTNRPQAQRYLLNTIIDQWHEASQPYVDEVIMSLKTDPPAAIIASKSDLRNMENPKMPITYRDLADWLRENYEPVEPESSGVWLLKE